MLLSELGGTGKNQAERTNLKGVFGEGRRKARGRDAIRGVWRPERRRGLRQEKPGRRETTKNQIAS